MSEVKAERKKKYIHFDVDEEDWFKLQNKLLNKMGGKATAVWGREQVKKEIGKE